MSILIPLEFTQVLLAQTSYCQNIGQTDLIVILALLGSLLTFATLASTPAALTISIPAAVAKVLAGLTIGASWTAITLPFDGLLDIAVVGAIVQSINTLSGCG